MIELGIVVLVVKVYLSYRYGWPLLKLAVRNVRVSE